MISRTVLCLWLVLFLYPGGLSGQVYTDRKVREYKVADNTSVEVSNKYGKIHVITWDIDSVKIEANLRISASNYQKMQKLRDNITFDFNATKTFIVAKTVFTNQATIISDFVDAFIPSNIVSINYMVYTPEYVNLKIDNKFGDIYMDDFNGTLELILSNGDLKANKLSGAPTVRLSSGDGTINSISDGKVFASYSDLQIRDAGKVSLETRSSVLTIDQGNEVSVDSRRDKFQIGMLNELSATGYFTIFNIDQLNKDLRCSLKYGNIAVQRISDAFSFINIESEYADIDLYFNRNTSYNLDISHHYDVYINLPANLARVETTVQNKDEKIMLTYGKIGNSTVETTRKVNINAPVKCNINIIHR
jgi:hypothetical protein